jgi:transcriptional regulator with XRE-family HTH domain
MARNAITNRTQLAKRLGLPTSRVTEAFNEDWSGRATIRLLYRLRREFGVDIGLLVEQPTPTPSRPVNGHA